MSFLSLPGANTKEQTPARLPGAAQPLPRRMLPPPRAAVENLSDVGGSFGSPGKRHLCFFFVIMVRNLNFI